MVRNILQAKCRYASQHLIISAEIMAAMINLGGNVE